VNENSSRIYFNFIAMVAPLISWVSNNLKMTCLDSQLVEKKLTTIVKTMLTSKD
jgi:hypothetical protein